MKGDKIGYQAFYNNVRNAQLKVVINQFENDSAEEF